MNKRMSGVATNGHKKTAQLQPHEIISGADKLDAGDMLYFNKVIEARQLAEQLAQQAQTAAIGAQSITQFFMNTVSKKYDIGSKDVIQPDGTIVRNPSIEIVE